MYNWFIYKPQRASCLCCVAPTVNEWLIRPLVVFKRETCLTEPHAYACASEDTLTHNKQTQRPSVKNKPLVSTTVTTATWELLCAPAYSGGVYVSVSMEISVFFTVFFFRALHCPLWNLNTVFKFFYNGERDKPVSERLQSAFSALDSLLNPSLFSLKNDSFAYLFCICKERTTLGCPLSWVFISDLVLWERWHRFTNYKKQFLCISSLINKQAS